MTFDSPSPADKAEAEAPRQTPMGDMARLGVKSGALLTAVLATVASIAFFVPDVTTYAYASVTKHKRLAEYDSRKIVLVGGSNLAFGIDSTMIQHATSCPVVNMGMNGYLGVRYMLEEIKTEIKPRDVVILAFEWDNFYKSVEGTSSDLLAIVKVNPVAFTFLSPRQKLDVITTIPLVAQAKAKRLIKESFLSITSSVTGRNSKPHGGEDQLIEMIESVEGFTPDGDLVSHLGVKWPYAREDGIIPKGRPIESQMIDLMRDFTTEMAKRDIAVMVSYTPVIREFYDRHQNELSGAHKIINTTPPLIAPSPPSAFVYDEPYFFDTVYHLNAEGRRLRTQKLIDDLKLQLNERVHCTTAAIAQSGD